MRADAIALVVALFVVALVGGLVAVPPAAAAALGICRQEAARSDGYMQRLCDGESALDEQQPGAAHCRAGDRRAGRDWAQRFGAARRIWIGETPCTLDSGAPNPKVPQEVHRDLCTEAFVADYALIRASPQSTVAQDIRTRLDGVQKSVEAACGAVTPAAAKEASPATKAAAQPQRKTRSSGRTASPAPGK